MADKEIGNSRLIKTWASTGDRVVPDDNYISEGWLFEQRPPHEIENDRQNQLGKKVNHVLKNGVPEWDSLNEYGLYDIVKHNNDIYYATGPSTNQEPPSGNWSLLSAQFFSNDATHLSGSANKSSPADADKMWLVDNSSTENRHITASELNSNFYGRDASNIRNSTNKPTPDDTDAFRIITSANANRRLLASSMISWIESEISAFKALASFSYPVGNHTYTVTPEDRYAYITVVGGGGGSSPNQDVGGPDRYIEGAGGGGGGFSVGWIDITGASSLSIQVGAGGSPQSNGQDSAVQDNNSTFDIRGTGGRGASNYNSPGAGGNGSGGLYKADGSDGHFGARFGDGLGEEFFVSPGHGGNSALGGGSNGGNGRLYGGGAGGGGHFGGNGIVVLTIFRS